MYKLKLIKSDIVSGWYILKIIKSGKFMVKYDKIIKTCGPLIHPQERLTQLPPGRTSLLGTALYFRVPTSMSCDWSCHQGHILSREQNNAKVWRFLAFKLLVSHHTLW